MDRFRFIELSSAMNFPPFTEQLNRAAPPGWRAVGFVSRSGGGVLVLLERARPGWWQRLLGAEAV